MQDKKNKKINHCWGASLQIIFNFLGIPLERIIPYPKFLLVDKEQEVDTLHGILHSLILEIEREEFITIYKSEGIEFEQKYNLSNVEIYESMKSIKYILLMVDTFDCPWCKFYRKTHYDHMCVLSLEENSIKVIDYIFQEKPFFVKTEIVTQISKSFFFITRWENIISYELSLKYQIINMRKYNKFCVQSDHLKRILLDKKQFILEEFNLKNSSAFLVTNFFKQFSEEIFLHNLFIRQCALENKKYWELYCLNKECEKILNYITFDFIKMSMSSPQKRIIYFDKIIDNVDKFYLKECHKKNFLELV